jgi:two-component system OmpR family response regulator
MGKLRRKLDEGGLPSMIYTVRGSGYILRAPD